MENIAMYAFIIIIVLIVIGYVIRKEENYTPVAVEDQILEPVPEGPQMEMEIGTTTLTQQMIDSINSDQIAEQEFSGNITKEMEELEENQVNDSGVNQEIGTIEEINQAVSEEKIKSIDALGMAKWGGLTQLDSNILAATKEYMEFGSFEDGEMDPEYEKILQRKQNAKYAISQSNVILNAYDTEPYVPNVGSGTSHLK